MMMMWMGCGKDNKESQVDLSVYLQRTTTSRLDSSVSFNNGDEGWILCE